MPVRLSLTEGTVADCTQAPALMGDLAAQYLLADRGYDTNAVVAEAEARGMEAVIPPRRHRKEPRDHYLYKFHLVENSFLDRAVATHAKNSASFLAICQIRATFRTSLGGWVGRVPFKEWPDSAQMPFFSRGIRPLCHLSC